MFLFTCWPYQIYFVPLTANTCKNCVASLGRKLFLSVVWLTNKLYSISSQLYKFKKKNLISNPKSPQYKKGRITQFKMCKQIIIKCHHIKAGGQEHSIGMSSCVGVFIPTDIHIAKLREKKSMQFVPLYKNETKVHPENLSLCGRWVLLGSPEEELHIGAYLWRQWHELHCMVSLHQWCWN